MSAAEATPTIPPAPDAWADWELRHALLLRRLTLIFVVFGIGWRVFRYLLAMPIWGDEAMLLVNYLTRDYADIFGPIDYCQIAPLLFHWAEMAMLDLFGPSEWSVRLPPLVASVAALGLFCWLARLTLSPLARTIAIGVLAVAIWPATTGSLVKPYAWDFLFATVLLTPYAAWRRTPARAWPLIILCIVAPMALTSSYTSVFIAGAIGIAMARPVWRSRSFRQIGLLALFTLLVTATFLAHYQWVGKVHLSSSTYGISTADGMGNFWKGAFPPADPLKLLAWIPLTLAGEIAAYPIGAQRGGSIVTAALCVYGAWGFCKRRESDLVVLFVALLLLWFVAAALQKYPMGSCRLGQHAGPLFCLFAGAGAADLLKRFVRVGRARAAVVALAVLLILIGLGGVARDIVRPYRDAEARDSRRAVRAVTEDNDTAILVAQEFGDIRIASVHWYLGAEGRRVHWAGRRDWTSVIGDSQEIWVVVCTPPTGEPEEAQFLTRLRARGADWTCVTRVSKNVTGKGPPEEQTLRAYLFRRGVAR